MVMIQVGPGGHFASCMGVVEAGPAVRARLTCSVARHDCWRDGVFPMQT